MKIALYSNDIDTIDYWKKQLETEVSVLESPEALTQQSADTIIIADYDTAANEINRLIQDDRLPKRLAVLERAPNTTSGKRLIRQGVKAYGNSRMVNVHITQLCNTLANNKAWLYPELMAAMINDSAPAPLNIDVELMKRLTHKELEVVELVLDGLTNEGISSRLEISVRTVKAHLSAIFSKLHVTDRLALVLLLK
jgi:DNA-binding NarL/FixJ family response regulator